jgi:hypothetical protein
MSDPIAVVCACCDRVWTLSEWNKLPLVGPQKFANTPLILLRNCLCGSTRGTFVDEHGQFIPADENGNPLYAEVDTCA